MLKPLVILSLLALPATAAYAQVPGPPSNLASVVDGTTVTLTWSPPSTGGVPGGYVVEASVVPGGPLVASLPVGPPSLVVPNVPNGVYYVHVRGLNGSGAGASSNEITVVVTGGCPAAPVPPQLAVRSVNLEALLSWGSGGGCAPTSYVLLAGSAPGLADVAQVNLGGQLELAAVAPAGAYYVRVVGTNPWGSAVSDELLLQLANNAQTDTVGPNSAVSFDIVMTASGSYSGTMVWSDPSIDLDLYLTTPGCGYPPSGCLLDISDATNTNTEQVSRTVQTGDRYRLWVDNFSERTTSFTIFNAVGAADARESAFDAGEGRTLQIRKVKP